MPLFGGTPNVEKLKKEGNVKELIKALRYKDTSVRHDAAYTLGMISSVKQPITLAIDPLIASLEDEPIRKMAALSLVRIINAWSPDEPHLKKMVNALVTAYKRDEDKDFRSSVINALEKIDADVAVDVLCIVYQNEDGDIKYAALRALGSIGEKYVSQRKSRDAAKASGKFVFEWDDFQESFKPGALEEIKDKEEARHKKMENTLVSALNDNDRNVWVSAALSLGNMQDVRAEKKLTSLLDDIDINVRNAAARALDEIKGAQTAG